MKRSTLLTLALAAALALPASAAVSISVTATALDTQFGYSAGQSYTFSVTLDEARPEGPRDAFTYESNYWACEDIASDPPLFSDVSGDGLTGTYTIPIANSPDGVFSNLAMIASAGESILSFWEGSDVPFEGIGLTAPDGATGIHDIGGQLPISIGNLYPAYPQTYVSPADYFAGYVGTYNVLSDSPAAYLTIWSTNWEKQLNFAPASMTISNTAIPEPSAAAVFSVLAGLGVLRRRRHA